MFNEANTVEAFVLFLLSGSKLGTEYERLRRLVEMVGTDTPTRGVGWTYKASHELGRSESQVLVESSVREKLVRLNPEIAADPAKADEVLYKLQAILVGVGADGIVKANEEFAIWLKGERTMPFGANGEHVPVRLIDFDNHSNNEFVVTNQFTFKTSQEKRFDVVLLVNGIPLVLGEAKTPVRKAITWVDGAAQVHDDYEVNVPAFFAPNIFSFATEGKTFRFGSVRMPLELWAPWRAHEVKEIAGLPEVAKALRAMLRPEVILDILQSFCVFATDKRHRKIKVICRYQQYEAANQIVERVLAGKIRKGLIWHFQGSGKSLLMVFAANKLRLHPDLKNPTVLIVVDRIDLDAQITATFNAADVPNTVAAISREELQDLLAKDVRKVVVTTIHKFGEAPGVLNERSNIILMVDEAHRTQEGDLGRRMREALPNAFLFGLTGTPINRRDRNTFWAFGASEDPNGYMSRYSFQESIHDQATLPLHFEARLVELRVDQVAIDEAFERITGSLSEEDQAELSKRAGKLAILLKAPERVERIVADIAEHYAEKIEPNGFKAQVVAFDREACVLYKEALDKIVTPETSEVVMSLGQGDPADWKKRFMRSKDEEEKLLDRFRDPLDPLKILIVTSRLLTGFDAPILQAMYLDKPMRDHNLLQAICRTNRPYPEKTHGLIVDYLGVFDDVARSLDFDDKAVHQVVTNLNELKDEFPKALTRCLDFFPGIDRSVSGYQGLIAAQEHLPDNELRDSFAAAYSYLNRHWEALSPDAFLMPYKDDYLWLSQVYESVQPPSGAGKLLWHALGVKTIELIHDNVQVEAVRDDLETLVLDAETLEGLKADPKEVEIKIAFRLREHPGNPVFIELGKRLEELREKHQQGILSSIEFLKSLLALARDVVAAEKEVQPQEEIDRGKAALTELFLEIKGDKTPVVVERIVDDMDEIVRIVRFEGWQQTIAGEREVQRALRKTLLKYKLHHDQDLFDRAYTYIKEYY